jgi:hypothetical protein
MSEELLEIERIKALKSRYCRYLDTKQWDKWATLFADDFTFTSGEGGREERIQALAAERQNATTVHHVHSPEIVMTGPETARGIWALHDYVEFPEIATTGPAKGYRGMIGAGHYEEEYRKVGDDWKISYMRVTRTRCDALAGPASPRIDGYPLSRESDFMP